MTSKDSLNVTFSPGSGAGHTHCGSPELQTMFQFGPDHAHANHSATPGNEKEQPTSGTCGLSSIVSFKSETLQRCLANKLRAKLGSTGSPEFLVTWKRLAIPQREPICALRASARRMYVNGFATLGVGKSRYGILLRDDGRPEPFQVTASRIGGLPGVREVEPLVEGRPVQDGWLRLRVRAPEDPRPTIAAAVAAAGGRVRALEERLPTLEEAFVSIVGRGG